MENSPSQVLQRYQRLVEVTHYLASKLELNSLLDHMMKIAVELVSASQASVLLYDQNSRQLYFQATTNTNELPTLQNVRVPEDSIAGWVALNRMPQIVNQVEQDARHFGKIEGTTFTIWLPVSSVPV